MTSRQISFNNPGLPGNPLEMQRKQPNVRVYFVATQLMNKKVADDGTVTWTSPIISAGGHGAMQMPPIGEFLEVPQNVAEILMRQTETWDRQGNKVVGITTDKTYADIVRQSFEKQIPIAQVVAEKASVNLTDDQLLHLIQQRPTVAAKLGLQKTDAGPGPGETYQDGKERRSEQTPSGENLYQDDPDGEDNADEVKYQDDVDAEGQPVADKPKTGRRSKKDSE